MQFHSLQFLIFFPIVLVVYFAVPRKARRIWLLICSYYFYMGWNPVYAILIALSTLLTYVCGLLIERFRALEGESGWKGRLSLTLCLVINLGILAVFKYGNFVIESVNTLLWRLHFSGIPGRLNLLLPVGISFYTFQALGYSIDVYRGDIPAERNFINYALFVSFFPQLVAGPIERSGKLLRQIQQIDSLAVWDYRRIVSGLILMVWGFFLKMVIADRAAIVANTVFDNWHMHGSTALILATLAFTLQIYCDFGSYSTIAIGAAKVLGIDLMENFNTPYFAQSIRDFWSRWHISLSTWFRDYLYIPLGGNRKGLGRKCLNLLIVFLVSGLWHGASWNFIAWGGIHGLLQVIGDFLKKPRQNLIAAMRIRTDCFSWRLLRMGITFCFVAFAWIFFRVTSISDALKCVARIFTRLDPWLWLNGGIYEFGLDRVEAHILSLSLLALFLVDFLRYQKGVTIDGFLLEQNLWFRWTVVIGLILAVFVFGEYGANFDPQQFIYFQF